MKISGIVLSILLLGLTQRAHTCTIFFLTDGNQALFFNNEDYTNPNTRIWFIPGSDQFYGCVFVGYDDGVAQGGMNSKGLAFDWYAGRPVSYSPGQDQVAAKGSSSERMLETCATVDEAIEFYKKHAEPGFARATILIADSSGASVIIGARNGKLNFDRSEKSRVLGYGTSIFQQMHIPGKPVEHKYGAGILKECFQTGEGGTKYSNSFDLKTGDIKMYEFANNSVDEDIDLNLFSELQKGEHHYEIPRLRVQLTEPLKPLTLTMQRMCLYNYSPLPDQEPRVTSIVRRILISASEGEVQARYYTDRFRARLEPIRQDIRSELKALGMIRSAYLIQRSNVDNMIAYTYLIIFDKARVMMRFIFDENLRADDLRSLRGEMIRER